MRRRGVARLATIVLLSLGLPVAASADDTGQDDAPPAKASVNPAWYGSHVFGAKRPPAPRPSEKKADKKPDKKAAAKAEEKKPAPESPARRRSKAEAAFFRRLAVCDQVMQIAAQTNDERLAKQAEEVSRRAWNLYSHQIEQLPLADEEAAPAKETKPPSAAKSDGRTKAQHKGDER